MVELPAATLDSLAANPLTAPPVDSARLVWLQTPATLYETVGDRLGCIETAAPHQFNAAVMAYVRLFTERQRGYTQRVLERSGFTLPTFEKYLTQYNLPVELKYLSVVESSLIPTAKSPVGAVGLWQFMPPTAGDLRLKRDEWVDERMHPEKATEAACKHLRYLYGEFHDWELVLAAYNWGAGNMRRVMRKTGKKSFWDLYPHLPAETRNYVPTFTAIMYAMTYAAEHSLHDPSPALPGLRAARYPGPARPGPGPAPPEPGPGLRRLHGPGPLQPRGAAGRPAGRLSALRAALPQRRPRAAQRRGPRSSCWHIASHSPTCRRPYPPPCPANGHRALDEPRRASWCPYPRAGRGLRATAASTIPCAGARRWRASPKNLT
ncbi:MAG: lytic transglycosylase domain-containing protein [Hymenobacter sp.]